MKRLILAALIALPFVSSATTFTCKAIQEGQIDSGSQKSSVETRLDVQDKSMKVSMGGKTWRLGFIGEKSIAKMYATPDGGIAVTTSTTAVIQFSLCAQLTTMVKRHFTR